MLTIIWVFVWLLEDDMNNKDKIEFMKRGVLWSHSLRLEESSLRLFDVNDCMKDRSNWPGVTLKFALFNHVFHIRCKKKWSLVVYNFILLLHEILNWEVMRCPEICCLVQNITEEKDKMGAKVQQLSWSYLNKQ